MTSWATTTAPIELSVDCGSVRHRIRWVDGELQLCDHPDLASELALIGFGGAEPPCLGLRRLWLDAVADGGFLGEWAEEGHLSRARLSWMTMALERMAHEGFHEFLRDLPRERAERMGRFVHGFPRPWLDRAAATVSYAVTDGDGVACERAPDQLDLAVAARLRRAFVQAVGGRELAVGTAALVPLDLVVSPDAAPTASGRLAGPERRMAFAVDRRWLHDVWATGAAVVDGHLVLARTGMRLTTVRWRDGRPSIEEHPAGFGDGRWYVEDRPGPHRQASPGHEGSC